MPAQEGSKLFRIAGTYGIDFVGIKDTAFKVVDIAVAVLDAVVVNMRKLRDHPELAAIVNPLKGSVMHRENGSGVFVEFVILIFY